MAGLVVLVVLARLALLAGLQLAGLLPYQYTCHCLLL
jgi:hypothetical protein